MSRLPWIAFLCAAGLGSAALVAPALARTGSTAPAVTPAPGGATAALEDCHSAVQQSDRSATFAGEMATLAGTRRMAIRVDLLERAPGTETFHGVIAPGLGVWRRSAPDVQIYRYVKQVVNLPAPAAFRAVISFRWFDAHGHVVRQQQRHTTVCEQADQRPLLRIGRFTVTPSAGSADATYAITVRNDGHGPAGPFALQLVVNGVRQPDVAVTGVAPLSRLEVDVTAPGCSPGSTVPVTLDPGGQLDEAPGGGLPRTFDCRPRA